MSEFFKIDQVSSGWFEGVVTDKSKSIYFSASYLTDFPNDLMNAMLYALGRIPNFDVFEGSNIHSFTVCGKAEMNELKAIATKMEKYTFIQSYGGIG